MEVVYGGSSNLSPLLNDIKLYLQYIYGNTDLMLDYLGDNYIILYNINQAVQYIKNNLSNYDTILQDINDNLDDIETEIDNINTYLNDTSINSSTITGNMPNNSNIVSPTDTILTTLFDNLQNVFLNDEVVDIVLPIPFVSGNKTITIYSNYTETYCPEPLKVIIRAFYWFVVSRWVLLSLFHLVDDIRDFKFMANTENGDPKTDLL